MSGASGLATLTLTTTSIATFTATAAASVGSGLISSSASIATSAALIGLVFVGDGCHLTDRLVLLAEGGESLV